MKGGTMNDVRLIYDESEGKFHYCPSSDPFSSKSSRRNGLISPNQGESYFPNDHLSHSHMISSPSLQRFNSLDSYLSDIPNGYSSPRPNANLSPNLSPSHNSLNNVSGFNRNQFEWNEGLNSSGALSSSPTLLELEKLQRFLPRNVPLSDSCLSEFECSNEIYDSGDSFRMYEFKIRPCMRDRSHDWTDCPFAHPGEKARRRDPRIFHYSGMACPDFRKGSCRKGDACEFAHGVFECWLHPARYRTQLCKDGRGCRRRVCFFAHTNHQLRQPTCVAGNHKVCLCNSSHQFNSPNSTLFGHGLSPFGFSPPLSPHMNPAYFPSRSASVSPSHPSMHPLNLGPPFDRKHNLERVYSLPSKSSLSIESRDYDFFSPSHSRDPSFSEKASPSTCYSATLDALTSLSSPANSPGIMSEMLTNLKALDIEDSLEYQRQENAGRDERGQKWMHEDKNQINKNMEKNMFLDPMGFVEMNSIQHKLMNQENVPYDSTLWNRRQSREYNPLDEMQVRDSLIPSNRNRSIDYMPPPHLHPRFHRYNSFTDDEVNNPPVRRMHSWKSMPSSMFSDWEFEADEEENTSVRIERVESGKALRASIYGCQSLNMKDHADALELAWIKGLKNENYSDSDYSEGRKDDCQFVVAE